MSAFAVLTLRARGSLPACACLGAFLPVLLSGCSAEPTSGGSVPTRFWGVVPQERVALAQLSRLRGGGVGSVRIAVRWRLIAPRPDGPRRWSDVDEVVGNATRAGLDVLPSVYGSPRWVARDERSLPIGRPRQRRAWSGFLRALVGRYGPGGSFWAAHPGLPRRPVRAWQIWNEPNFFYFARRPDPGEYGRLVKLSHGAIAAVDPEGRLILGGMFALPSERPPRAYPAHRFLALMYKRHPGIGRFVDGIAIHPYTRDVRYLRPILDQVRGAVSRAGDPGVALWITEIGWGSQSGRQATLLEKGRGGQARQLSGAVRVLLKNRARWRLRRVYWFTVTDTARPDACNFCDSAGLFTVDFEPKPAWRAFRRLVGEEPR